MKLEIVKKLTGYLTFDSTLNKIETCYHKFNSFEFKNKNCLIIYKR